MLQANAQMMVQLNMMDDIKTSSGGSNNILRSEQSAGPEERMGAAAKNIAHAKADLMRTMAQPQRAQQEWI